jgi:hypothetical protein
MLSMDNLIIKHHLASVLMYKSKEFSIFALTTIFELLFELVFELNAVHLSTRGFAARYLRNK